MINIDKNKLADILLDYDANRSECYPMRFEAFVSYIFEVYRDRLNPEGILKAEFGNNDIVSTVLKSTCDSQVPENK